MMDVKKYREMDCPVCGKFHFSKLEEGDAEIYDFMQCPSCGWICDTDQSDSPDEPNGLNTLSLNQYKAVYKRRILNDPEYNFSEETYVANPHMCPVCGRHQFPDEGTFDVCPWCGWVDDSVMEEEPDQWAGNANELCLNDFRRRYQQYLTCKPHYKYSKDGFPPVNE